MKVIGLHASNVMNLNVVDIVPDGDIVILSGKNGAGKSNVLNAIELALSGKALKATAEPVRHGQKSGDIVLDLGDMVIKRHFTNNSSSLHVENGDGMVYKSPQSLLDGLRGKISFDPMHFADLPEKQQKEILLRLIDLPVDLDELAEQRKEIFQNRTLVNRDVKQMEGQMAGIPDLPDIPDDEISAVEVMEQMQEATEQIAANKTTRDGFNLILDRKQYIIKHIKEIELQLEVDRINLIELDAKLSKMSSKKLIDPDLEQFKCQLEDVENINQKVRQKQERNILFSKTEVARANSNGLTADIQDIDKLKSKTIQEVNMPITGLGFDENGVTFKDIPLSQRSLGEQRKISAAIGMALNPKLRVLWIKDASLLDTESIEDLKALAAEHDYQLWLEIVSDEGNIGIHIKDGRVVE